MRRRRYVEGPIWTSGVTILLGGLASAAEPGPALDADPATAVDRVVEDLAPTADERRFDEIGWARDIREGRRLSRESGRPLFLFTHDGRMAVGRC
ncbi:MAG TPA: hypothetical protein VFV24_05795 [Candidatus Eisenbacteria bacterium]|nr:hypothetical protein [Candidatus Eisenbacteria bacterium]